MDSNFYYILYSILIAMCPRDTGNMVTNIMLEDFGDYWKITVSGPNGAYDYAAAVNYGLAAKAQNRSMSAKETQNYLWIQKAIEQAGKLVGEVKYEV